MIFRKKKQLYKPVIEIKSIIKPIKLKKDEKLILIAGDGDDAPDINIFEDIHKWLKDALDDSRTMVFPCHIKAYIVNDKHKIELYKGDNIEE